MLGKLELPVSRKLLVLAILVSCQSPQPAKRLPPENMYFMEEITEIEMQNKGCKKEIVDDEPFYMCPDKVGK